MLIQVRCIVKNNLTELDEKKIELLLSKVKFEVKFIDRVQYVFVNGEDVSEKIRTAEVSNLRHYLLNHLRFANF